TKQVLAACGLQVLANAAMSCSRKRPIWDEGMISEAREIVNTNVMGNLRIVRETVRQLADTEGQRPVWILLTEGQGESSRLFFPP
ncbi:MAG: hypothetical protein AAGJ35_08925, partial [Myxococcota bacterium]